jgi:hypothetical protein
MNYFSIASLSAQSASIKVTGANMKFSAATPEARFPNVFNNRNAKMIQTRIFITLAI